MKSFFGTLGLLLKKFDEEHLLAAIPIFSRIVAELVEDISGIRCQGNKVSGTFFTLQNVL